MIVSEFFIQKKHRGKLCAVFCQSSPQTPTRLAVGFGFESTLPKKDSPHVQKIVRMVPPLFNRLSVLCILFCKLN